MLLIIPLYIFFEATIVTEKVAAIEITIREMQIPNETFLFKGNTSKKGQERSPSLIIYSSLFIIKLKRSHSEE